MNTEDLILMLLIGFSVFYAIKHMRIVFLRYRIKNIKDMIDNPPSWADGYTDKTVLNKWLSRCEKSLSDLEG